MASSAMKREILSSVGCSVALGAKSMRRTVTLSVTALQRRVRRALHGAVGIFGALVQRRRRALGTEVTDGVHGRGAHRRRERLVGGFAERLEHRARRVAGAGERARAGDG